MNSRCLRLTISQKPLKRCSWGAFGITIDMMFNTSIMTATPKQFCLARFSDTYYEMNCQSFGWLYSYQLADWEAGRRTCVTLENHSVERCHLNLKRKLLEPQYIVILGAFGAFAEFGVRDFEVASARYADLLDLPDDSPLWGTRLVSTETLIDRLVTLTEELSSNG